MVSAMEQNIPLRWLADSIDASSSFGLLSAQVFTECFAKKAIPYHIGTIAAPEVSPLRTMVANARHVLHCCSITTCLLESEQNTCRRGGNSEEPDPAFIEFLGSLLNQWGLIVQALLQYLTVCKNFLHRVLDRGLP